MKWWAQPFLVGISSVICGYKDDDGVVNDTEEFDVAKLSRRYFLFTFYLKT